MNVATLGGVGLAGVALYWLLRGFEAVEADKIESEARAVVAEAAEAVAIVSGEPVAALPTPPASAPVTVRVEAIVVPTTIASAPSVQRDLASAQLNESVLDRVQQEFGNIATAAQVNDAVAKASYLYTLEAAALSQGDVALADNYGQAAQTIQASIQMSLADGRTAVEAYMAGSTDPAIVDEAKAAIAMYGQAVYY